MRCRRAIKQWKQLRAQRLALHVLLAVVFWDASRFTLSANMFGDIISIQISFVNRGEVCDCLNFYQTVHEVGAINLRYHCSDLVSTHWDHFTSDDFAHMSAPLLYNIFKTKTHFPLLDLFPPQMSFPLCTIAHTPRLPEHCIEYVRILLWNKEKPFGDDLLIDGDDPNHLQWIYDKSVERALEFGIEGVTYRLTAGVIKHIIPAVASTNAIIAAACATEVFKMATLCAPNMSNYMMFNDNEGVYTYTYAAERKEDCLVCSNVPKTIRFDANDKLENVINLLIEEYQMKSPGITTTTAEGKLKTLYMQSVVSIEEATRPNLKKSLKELGLQDGQQLVVADITTANALIFVLKFNE